MSTEVAATTVTEAESLAVAKAKCKEQQAKEEVKCAKKIATYDVIEAKAAITKAQQAAEDKEWAEALLKQLSWG